MASQAKGLKALMRPMDHSDAVTIPTSETHENDMSLAIKLYIIVGALAGACLILGIIYGLILYFGKKNHRPSSRSSSFKEPTTNGKVPPRSEPASNSTHIYLKFYSQNSFDK